MAASDTFVFIKEVSKSFAQIGSVIPSSSALARALVRPMLLCERGQNHPLRILEVGPGTGPVTRQILGNMQSEDTLMVCEINPRFMKRLQERLVNDEHFQRNKERVSFFQGPVQALHTEEQLGKFDVIVSSLPFSNFQPQVVEEIFKTYRDLLKDGGSITFCEYIGIRKIGALVANPEERARVKQVDQVVKRWCDRSECLKKEITFLNVPPAFTVELSY